MLKHVRQARAAFSMLSADQVRKTAEQPVHFGLVADGSAAYAEMEDFLVPGDLAGQVRIARLLQVHRASEEEPPSQVDLVLYEPGLPCPNGAFTYRRLDPSRTVAENLDEKPEFALPLARQFPAFRAEVVERIIHEVA